MIDAATSRSALFSRQQVARLTGLDDSTLNYWMRENVLMSSAGGGGKGQHRRFPFHQINLALLLSELRGFGVSLPEIKRLALKFHDGVAYFDQNGITGDNEDAIATVLRLRREVTETGSTSRAVLADAIDRHLEVFPWLIGRELTKDGRAHLRFTMNFEEALDTMRRGALAYGREPDSSEILTDQTVELALRLDENDFYRAARYWRPITDFDAGSTEGFYLPLIVYRDDVGDWEITSGDPPSHLGSYVGVNLADLAIKAWNRA